MRAWTVSILVFIAATGLAQNAFAYIDPGSGSILLQLILGGVAGVLVVVKMYWQKLKAGAGSLKRIFR
ncbi:MAG TPA: hypothetical protein VJ805_02050 [Nitrospiraceae bacterium]|nr:hypothetical protein [Nitrospiraceae bacterium]